MAGSNLNPRPRRHLSVETLESRKLMANDLGQSFDANLIVEPQPVDSVPAVVDAPNLASFSDVSFDTRDTNSDGKLTPLDALLVINHLNRVSAAGGESDLDTPEAIAQLESFDVNLDGRISPLDVLLVINAINQAVNRSPNPQDIPSSSTITSFSPIGGCSCGGAGCHACDPASFMHFV